MIISIASGKGGTGKTTVATNLAVSLGGGVQLLDCDVEEPNAHLFIHPVFEKTEIVSTAVPEVDETKCNLCGKCGEICQFKAIIVIGKTVLPFQELCHSCGGCMEVCPEHAIREGKRVLGEIEVGHRNGLEFIHGRLRVGEAMAPPLIRKVLHARLGIAEENSGKLVTLVRQEARKVAEAKKLDLILTDGPPGIGCPVIASLGGTSAALIVTEPTVAGRHDMERVAQLADFFRVPVMVCVNKADINPDSASDIQHYAEQKGYTFLGPIPFDPVFTKAMVAGQTVIEYDNHTEAAAALRQIWQKVLSHIELQAT